MYKQPIITNVYVLLFFTCSGSYTSRAMAYLGIGRGIKARIYSVNLDCETTFVTLSKPQKEPGH